MGILNIFYKLYQKIFETHMGFSHSADEDKRYLWNFPEPKDDIERSYFQYLCQKWNCNSKLRWILMNAVCCLMIFPIQTYFYIAGKRKKRNKKQYYLVMTRNFMKNDYASAQSTIDAGGNIKCLDIEDYGKGILTKNDLRFLKKIWNRHSAAFYFYFKCMCRIASYSRIVNLYCPKEIYASAEYSFTSSVLTAYCESIGIKHVNVMHGEKIFDLKDAFSRFHKFYIWDDFYINLFHKLRADKTEYVVQRQNFPDFIPNKKSGKCVYYLQVHESPQLEKIKSALDKTGMEYKVRPHPIHMNKKIEEIFGTEKIEDPYKVNIWDSLKNAGCAISVASTVLLQAFWIGIPIIIDDISNPDYSRELRLREYIIFNKKVGLLSEMQAE